MLSDAPRMWTGLLYHHIICRTAGLALYVMRSDRYHRFGYKEKQLWGGSILKERKPGDYEIPDNPEFFLLHLSEIPISKYKKSILRHLINAARACIPLHW